VSAQAPFLAGTEGNVIQRPCSTSSVPQYGQLITVCSYLGIVSVFEKNLLQDWHRKSYWGTTTSVDAGLSALL
ncbi:MAG TPA: hypothetical protein VFV92_16715, partial [Candidatus Bathyarchaeia archaeon]|nr:hypothetical protein [Candidatus Bathyarchaeia archaeon]